MQISLIQRIALPPGSALVPFFCVGLNSKNLGFEGHMVSVEISQLRSFSVIAAIGNRNDIKMNEPGRAPIKLYLWNLKLKFHVFFTS